MIWFLQGFAMAVGFAFGLLGIVVLILWLDYMTSRPKRDD